MEEASMKKYLLQWLGAGFVSVKLTGGREAILVFDNQSKAMAVSNAIVKSMGESGSGSRPVALVEVPAETDADIVDFVREPMSASEAANVEVVFETDPLFSSILNQVLFQ